MENEQDLCNVEEICIKVGVYRLLHGYKYTRCVPLWPLASSCSQSD